MQTPMGRRFGPDAAGRGSQGMITALRLVSAAYEQVVRLRNRGYDAGWLKVRRLQRPVISVGNLTLGGTGKTPAVIALGTMLQGAGYSVSVLLRGYKGRHRGGPLPVSDGRRIRSNSGLAGDEALVIARNLPGAMVTVGKDRARAGRCIESRGGADLHLLDDGFQHRRLHRCLDLVLVDVTNPFGGGRLAPSGRLREPPKALRRADAVILTRTRPGQDYDSLTRELRRFKPELPCFLSTQTVEPIARRTAREERVEAPLSGCRALAFAGLANPHQFFDCLRQQGVELVQPLPFGDHHRYSVRDLTAIGERCRELRVDTAITTEKDAENLPPASLHPAALRVLIARVSFEFVGEGLREMLLKTLDEESG